MRAVSNKINFGDQYEILSVLGEGGMGTVYKVLDKTLNKHFAFKVLRPELAKVQSVVSRFNQEAQAASRLTHVNLASVYASGKAKSGLPYLVMDFLDGKNLEQILEKNGFVESDKALDIFIEICDALEHAHAKGIIHRDLKPSNVILVDNEERVKIVDFGIAKILPRPGAETMKLTFGEEVLGSPTYMSPEQCRGDELDVRSDVYSMGCLMYEVLTGRPPFQADNAIKTILKHLHEEPPNLAFYLKDRHLPEFLEVVVLKCLAKNSKSRYQNVFQLRMDLNAVREGRRPKARTKYSSNLFKKRIIHFSIVLSSAAAFVFTMIWDKENLKSPVPAVIEKIVYREAKPAPPVVQIDQEKLDLQVELGLAEREKPVDYSRVAAAEFELVKYYSHKTNIPEATIHMEKVIDLLDKIPDTQLISKARYLYSMGFFYEWAGRHEAALKYFKASVAVQEKLPGIIPGIGASYNELANFIGIKEGNRKEAEQYYKKAYSVFKNEFGENCQEIAQIYSNMSRMYTLNGMRAKVQHYKRLASDTRSFSNQTPIFSIDSRNNFGASEVCLLTRFNGLMPCERRYGSSFPW